ncbi:hypothetical protein K0038_00690 [Pseudomonas syringae]|nr:hypothetical protein [Pseudomonas syringae]
MTETISLRSLGVYREDKSVLESGDFGIAVAAGCFLSQKGICVMPECAAV